MTGPPDDLLSRLYDIRGLDHIGWWPLAPGWWGLLGLAAIALMLAGAVYRRRLAYARSWKGDAWRALAALDAQLPDGDVQKAGATLSGLMRRVAMQCHSREECAGLQGQDWLRWLTAKDPGGFDWAERGLLLIDAPYAPPGRYVSTEPLKALIDAARGWIK
jgi:hypothetical protein